MTMSNFSRAAPRRSSSSKTSARFHEQTEASLLCSAALAALSSTACDIEVAAARFLGELLRERTGLKRQHVPYRGAAPAVQDLIGGRVPFALMDSASVQQHLLSGKLRGIGVASPARLKTMADIPTLAEQGLSGFEAYAWQGLVAPRGTDEATIQMWSRTLQETLKTPAVQARFESLALEPLPSTPEQMREFWLSEKKRWGEVIKTAGIKLD